MWKILFSLFQKISMTSVMWFFIILQHKITYKSNNNLPIFAYIWPNFTQYFPSKFFQNFCPLPSRTPMLKMLLGTVSASCLNSPTWNRNAMGTALLQRSLNFTFADHRVVFSFFQNTVSHISLGRNVSQTRPVTDLLWSSAESFIQTHNGSRSSTACSISLAFTVTFANLNAGGFRVVPI